MKSGADVVRKVWKYPIRLTERQLVTAPLGATFLHAAAQGDTICLWAGVDPKNPPENRIIRIYGTGHDVDDDGAEYIGTVHVGGFVWHVFEGIR